MEEEKDLEKIQRRHKESLSIYKAKCNASLEAVLCDMAAVEGGEETREEHSPSVWSSLRSQDEMRQVGEVQHVELFTENAEPHGRSKAR